MGKSSPPPLPLPPPQQPPPIFPSPPQQPPSPPLNLDNKISPSILLIIVIIAIIFFISGLLHLLIRLLLKPIQRNPDELFDQASSVLQGQLRQLFHLHDSGVDQSYIDTLPIFLYKSIIGLKDPFDCAVCLCAFEFDDKLRLLPKCSHAFHVDCIDTWLLSHSTCPLCRSSLLGDFGSGNGERVGCNNPIVCVLESGSVDNSREIDRERVSVSGLNPHLGFLNQVESGSGQVDDVDKVVNVKLGKFRNVDIISNESSENNISNNNNNNNNNNVLGSRRCYSMGSYAYVLDETSTLQVQVKNTQIIKKKQMYKKKANNNLPIKPGYRAVKSEYGCDSHREFSSIEALKTVENSIENDNVLGMSKGKESFSISKIWGRNKGKGSESTADSSFEVNVSEIGNDEETQSCYSVDSLAFPATTTNSSTRRTLLWLMGRHSNKIVHSHSTSLSSNV